MENFYCRSKPLGSLDNIYKAQAQNFDIREYCEKDFCLSNNDVLSITEESVSSLPSTSTNLPEDNLDLATITCPEDLESYGHDKLKTILKKRGMRCGGTLKEKASRLWKVN